MLTGIRVLDLSRVLAGPLCTMTLGDLGADVLKVERPGTGDETRGWGPPFAEDGASAYFRSINRNKKSVAADLADPDAALMVRRLAGEADVVVENFRPGALARLGLSPGELLQHHPHLIWCTISGFGIESDRAGYDVVAQAESGWMSITGEPEGTPMKVGVALADVIAGKDAAVAILAALVSRGRTGRGRRIVISLAHSAVASLVNVAQNVLVTGAEARRWGNAHPNLVPYQLFDTADRPMIVAVGNDAQWRACTRALGLEELGDASDLETNAGRVEHRDEVVRALAARLVTRPAAEWRERLENEGVPSGLVCSVREALAALGGASPLTGVPPAVPGAIRMPPPRLDEHGEAVRAHGWMAFA
jgi:crotonobetainyl-CoA:carnitine CoA-transferase CaiB-like acyl-CoA transferase